MSPRLSEWVKVCRGVCKVVSSTSKADNSDALAVNRLVDKLAGEASLSPQDKLRLASYAARWAFNNPYQGQAVAILGEITGEEQLRKMRDRLDATPSGRRVLQDRIPVFGEWLWNHEFTPGTLGNRLKKCVPEERSPVSLVKDPELAFVMRRYRDAHDLIHAVSGLPVSLAGETAVKWFETASTQLPMTTAAALGGIPRCEEGSLALLLEWIPWAASAGTNGVYYLGIDFEEHAHTDLDVFRRQVLRWPSLPASLADAQLMKSHYAIAILQARRESREPKALEIELADL